MAAKRTLVCVVALLVAGCTQTSSYPPDDFLAPVLERPRAMEPATLTPPRLTIGEFRDVVAPPGSATAGSAWVVADVSYVNTSSSPIWVYGYAADCPFYGTETRATADGAWVEYPSFYCGNGAAMRKVQPGESWTFSTTLPARFKGGHMRVRLGYCEEESANAAGYLVTSEPVQIPN